MRDASLVRSAISSGKGIKTLRRVIASNCEIPCETERGLAERGSFSTDLLIHRLSREVEGHVAIVIDPRKLLNLHRRVENCDSSYSHSQWHALHQEELRICILIIMAQYRPMMAGHPLSQQWKKEEEEGFYTTSLHVAALEGDTHALLGLLRAGAFVDAPDHDLKTPLHLAAACE